MASKSDITFSLGVEIDKNTIDKSMSETERLLSSYKTKLEKSILKDFNTTVGGASTNRLFGGNKNAHIMSMRDDLGSLFKGINKSNTFTQMDKTLNKVADVFAKYQTGFKTGSTHTESKNAWLKKYSDENTAAFDKIYKANINEIRSQKNAELKKIAENKSRTHEFDDVLNGFGNNANDLNAFEDRNRAYLNLLKQRNEAKKRYDKSGDIGALKEYTSADQQLKALKDQGKEKKSNAKEEKGSLLRFGKMLVTLHLIKKVLNSIKDIWKRLSDTELKVTGRDVKEKGFFSVDAYSAMHANVDRSHAVISRGLGYMGAAAPFSMEAFDSMLQQLQDLNLKAISGQGIADEQLVISLQRLSDSLGMGFNIKDILTDPNLNLTDFLTNLMNSVEKFLPKLNSLDDIKKSLVTNDIIKALGPELANALVYNYNYNQRTGGTSTVMEQVISKGTNAYGLIDYTEEAKKFADALASSRSALDDFKVALAGIFAPAGKKVTNQFNENVAEATMVLNSIKSKSTRLNKSFVYSGSWLVGNKDKEELSEWYKDEENQRFASSKLSNAINFSSLDDIINYAYYNPTALTAGTSAVGVEKLVGFRIAENLIGKINGKTIAELKKEREANPERFSDEEWDIITKNLYWGQKDTSKYRFSAKNDKDIERLRDFTLAPLFGEGGVWDFNPSMSPADYVRRILGEEEYQKMMFDLLSEENNVLQESKIMKEGGLSYFVPTDEKGNKISGTVTLRLELSDGTFREIPTLIEEGVIKSMANQPAIQIER